MLKYITLIKGIGYDSNIYVIDNEVLVDTGTGENFSQIKDFMKNNMDVSRIKKIINTHCHYDHVGGNKKFRDWLGAEIMVHENDAYAIEHNTEATVADMFGTSLRAFKVNKKLKDNDVINTEHLYLRILHTPGHTAGSICIFEETSKTLITGDTLFDNTCGRHDLPSGNRQELIESLKKILDINPKHILPGHGNIKSHGIEIMIKQILHRL